MLFNERVLSYIWKFRLFNQASLKTSSHQSVEIIHQGLENLNAGPDFQNAKIKIDNTLWAGNVEIHLRSSDWLRHHHEIDKSYDNVILHVVWANDLNVYRSDKTLIPVLELQNLVDPELVNKINNFANSLNWIPCEYQLKEIDDFTIKQWLDRMLIERLEEKSAYFKDLHQNLRGNWEDTFYVGLARSFGFKVNSLPFEMLAKSLPQQILAKHKNNALQIEALVFGVSGLLNADFKEDYPQQLKKEFEFLRVKYGLTIIDSFLWKFSKTRPDNFPTIRLAQFAALIAKSVHLFSKIIETHNVKLLKSLFGNLEINAYWDNHYLFDQYQNSKKKNIGEGSVDVLLVNTVVPLLFFYGTELDKEELLQRADQILLELKPEKNSIINTFADIGIKAKSAFESQALLQLKNNYCNQKKCLNCSIGIKILKT